jgi:hypothetical protein
LTLQYSLLIVSIQYNKANGKGNGCVFTVHDFAGIKWSVDTAIEFHEDKNAYALLRCNAWDSVIDLEEVFYCRLLCDFFTALTLDLPLLGVRCLHARVSPVQRARCATRPASGVNNACRFHRLRYKLAPVGALEVSLGELQQMVVPEQASREAGSGSRAVTVGAASAIPSDVGSDIFSTISFKAP